MTNKKKQQIIELLKDKETADAIGVISEGLVKLFESIPVDEPEEKKPYDPGFWLPETCGRYYETVVTRDAVFGFGKEAYNEPVGNPYNCWKTSERAIQVGKKIRFLMLVERIRDVVERGSDDFEGFYLITFDNFGSEFDLVKADEHYGEPYTSSMFFSSASAREACDILNKMKADGQLDWLFK